jgi:hypothetical protein
MCPSSLLKAKFQRVSSAPRRFYFAPIIVCAYLLACLFVFLILQGDPNDWRSFMGGEASMALFGLCSIVGVVGISVAFFFKRTLRILEAPRRIITVTFLAAIIIGVAVFTYLNFSATQENYDWMHDGLLYQQMGQSFLLNREFIVDGLYTHHFGPIYPLYLSMFYVFLPVHLGTQVAVEVIFALSVVVVFASTKKLYRIMPGLISTALIVTIPTYVFSTSRNYSEPMVLILYTLTIYFILESLQSGKANRIILAGLFAALGFLTKSSLGYFFIITGIVGFLWRFYYMKWRVFKNKHYLIAVLVFLALVLAWTARNLSLFWDGTFSNLFVASQPSQYLNDAVVHSFTKDLGSFFVQFWFFAVLSAFFLLPYIWLLAPYIKNAFNRIRDERVSCLLLSITLPLLIGLFMGAIDFVYENEWMPNYWITYYPVSQVRYLTFTLIRYFFIAIVPLTWLAYELATKKPDKASGLH